MFDDSYDLSKSNRPKLDDCIILNIYENFYGDFQYARYIISIDTKSYAFLRQ